MISKKLNKIGILNLLSDTFTYGLGSGIQKILSLALIFLISKELTVEEFGIFDFYLIFSNPFILFFKSSPLIALGWFGISTVVKDDTLLIKLSKNSW